MLSSLFIAVAATARFLFPFSTLFCPLLPLLLLLLLRFFSFSSFSYRSFLNSARSRVGHRPPCPQTTNCSWPRRRWWCFCGGEKILHPSRRRKPGKVREEVFATSLIDSAGFASSPSPVSLTKSCRGHVVETLWNFALRSTKSMNYAREESSL